MRRSVSAGAPTMPALDANGECRFRIAALRRTMRIGIRMELRRKAIAVEMDIPVQPAVISEDICREATSRKKEGISLPSWW